MSPMPLPADTPEFPAPQLLGIMLPSANTVVEPVTTEILRGLGVTPLFTRFAKRGATDPSPDRHDLDALLAAADLLADARPAAIVLAAGKGAVIGLMHDRALADAILHRTGIVATTPALALPVALRALGVSRIALIGPHDRGYNLRAARGLAEAGIETVAEESLGLSDNLAFASVGPGAITAQARRAAAAPGVQAIVAWNTNCATAPLAGALEAELGLPVLDATALGVWAGLGAACIAARPYSAWGRLFAIQPPAAVVAPPPGQTRSA
jgi:maleate isomerase